MGGKTISTSDTKIEAMQLQSSAYGVTIPLVYGLTRVPGNLVWYGGFKANPVTTTQSGGKGGVKTQNTTFNYTASVMMGVCAGVINGIPRIWKGKQQYGGGIPATTIISVNETYTVAGPSYQFTPSHTVRALIGVTATFGVGENAAATWLAEGAQYHYDGTLFTFDPSLAGTFVTISYQYVSGSTSQAALNQLGLTYIDGHLGQAAWGPLSTIAPTQVLGYSGLAIVAGQDYSLGTGAQVDNHNFEVQGSLAYTVSSSVPDVAAADFISDVITNTYKGAAFPPDRLVSLSSYRDYCLASGLLFSPALDTQQKAADVVQQCCDITNSGPVWSGDRLKIIPYADQAVTGNGKTYTPSVTPIYDLTDDHFLDKENPITVDQKTPADRYNHVRIEWLDRGAFNSSTGLYTGEYPVTIAEAKDQADIDLNGLRSMPITQAHWICDANVAKTVSQLVLQRSVHVVNTYTFKLPWCFALLEPMDLVTITDPDPNININKLVVRVTSTTEDGAGEITVECEDWPGTTATATAYPNVGGTGFSHDYNVSPGSVLTPYIFETAGALTETTGLQVLAAATSNNPNWGGCNVWVSLDGTEYRKESTIYGGSRYGLLTGPISGGNLPVALNAGVLTSGSTTDSALLSTLCYIGGANPEFLAYYTATLTSALHYTLSGLTRSAYGSGNAAHSTNDPFVRIDSAVAESGPIDLSYIGKTIHLKFTSFNIYGGAEESLASVTDYTYTLNGAQLASGITYGQSDFTLVPASGSNAIVINGNAASKMTGNGTNWDAAFASKEGYKNGAYVTFTPVQNNCHLMVGFASNAAQSNANYSSLSYQTYCDATGNISVYEGATPVAGIGAYSANDVFSMLYDGYNISWLRNGSVYYGPIAIGGGFTFFAGSSFYSLGGAIKNFQFGPTSPVVNLVTGQATNNAWTDLTETDHDFAGTDTGGGTGTATWGSFTVTPSWNASAEFTAHLATSGVDGDSGNRCGWQVNDGTTTTSFGSIGAPSTAAKGDAPAVATINVVAGTTYTFSIVTQRLVGANPHMFLYLSGMRVTLVKK